MSLESSDGLPDLQSLLQQASAMQDRLLQAQQNLQDARVEASTGGGAVSATVTGTGDLVSLRIDPSVCDPNDAETLADLVVAAIHKAVADAQSQAVESLGDLTGGFGGELPAAFSGFVSPRDDPAFDSDED